MRIVFMGTPEFAVPSLDKLLEHGYDILSVVTVPDKPSGRGLQYSASAIKEYAVQKGLPILQPEKMKDPEFVKAVESLKPDLIVVVAFRILPPEIFRIPARGAFNLHASLLPKYRGAAPINWAIIRGEKETGVTTFFLQESVDTGNVLLQARIPIGPDATAGDVHDRLAEIGAEIVLHTVRLIEEGKAVPRPQDNTLASPAPKITRDDCRIDWTKSAVDVHNFIRGLSPRPVAYSFHGKTLLKIYRSRVVPDKSEAKPGAVLVASRQLMIGTGNGVVEILEIQQEGKRKMSAEEFLRGHPYTVDDTLS